MLTVLHLVPRLLVLLLAIAGAPSWSRSSILLNRGDGTFPQPRELAVGRQPRFVATEDLNAEGILDLAVVNYLGNSVSVLLGKANGTFTAASEYAVGRLPLDMAVANALVDSVTLLINDGQSQ